ncbi:MAG: ATP-dependent helicase RecQ [Bacteroidetes bacterium]|nr:ATP-dependent helicase RecQ [Bacteroidota bacterium]
MDIFHQILQQYWGYDSFRPLQEDIIHSVNQKKDTLGLMPTGGGKSLTFQVPAMAMDGVCLVVTPLISLMKDQVDNLRQRGIKAVAVYSGMKRHEILVAFDNVILGDYKFLYISPERLATELFLAKLKSMNVSLLVVDEAHCISQWGYDFRPSYLTVADIRKVLPGISVLALTATATPEVVKDIQSRLQFKQENVFQKSFDRSNLHYVVRQTENKMGSLVHIIERTEGTAIVYVRSRDKTKEIAGELKKLGHKADFYHAGLSPEEKNRKQNEWKNGECRIIVATNAFGMGIDKPDVRLVVHMDFPNSIEEYYQEAGRAGRDEKKAFAVMLHLKADSAKLKKRIADEFPEKEFIKQVYDQLAYFFQVADGFGVDRTFDFDLHAFCGAYKLPMLPTHHALKILEMAGYIEYADEVDNRSRLMFTVFRDELYRFSLNAEFEQLINIVLRLYTGLFADYVTIDESAISAKLGKSRKEIYEMFVALSKQRILDYIPHKKTPLITYRQARMEQKFIVITKDVYEIRKKRYVERITAMGDYATRTDVCRSRMLLMYLGEKNVKDCGRCDVCLARKKQGVNQASFEEIRVQVQQMLAERDCTVSEIIEKLSGYDSAEVTSVIRFLLDQRVVLLDLDKLYLPEKHKN